VRSFRWPALILSLLMSGVPAAFAHTTVHQMGVAPLLGVSSTTAEIREKVSSHPRMMHRAAESIGLTPREYSAFYNKFMNQKPGWVTIPRHLDAMTWSSEGVVHSEYDVTIPAGTNGWEVDLYEKHQIVRIFLPMICGNLSVLRVPRKEVAERPPLPIPLHRVIAPVPPPPAPVAPVPVPLTSVAQDLPPVAPPVVHHPRLFWPIVGAAVIAGVLLSHPHHHDNGTPTVTPPPVAPPHCGCQDTQPVATNNSWGTMGAQKGSVSLGI
jgi:hypothetical protein